MTDWQDAKSSMMKSFRYLEETIIDGVTFGRLEVEWANGTKGAYLDMNQRTYDEFVAAESRGKFLNSVIKPGFKYARIEQEKTDDGEKEEQETESA